MVRSSTKPPAVTLTSGLAASHQAILGDRMRLPLDAHLSSSVTGSGAPVANPGLVTDIAIGQSTVVTHHVKANLFYRGLRFHRFPVLGDTLYTRTEVVGLRENSAKPGRGATGLAALRMTSADQNGNTVLDFYRCAMLPPEPPTRSRRELATPTTSGGRSVRPNRLRTYHLTVGTSTRIESGYPAGTSIPIWWAPSSTAAATSSPAHPNLPG